MLKPFFNIFHLNNTRYTQGDIGFMDFPSSQYNQYITLHMSNSHYNLKNHYLVYCNQFYFEIHKEIGLFGLKLILQMFLKLGYHVAFIYYSLLVECLKYLVILSKSIDQIETFLSMTLDFHSS